MDTCSPFKAKKWKWNEINLFEIRNFKPPQTSLFLFASQFFVCRAKDLTELQNLRSEKVLRTTIFENFILIRKSRCFYCNPHFFPLLSRCYVTMLFWYVVVVLPCYSVLYHHRLFEDDFFLLFIGSTVFIQMIQVHVFVFSPSTHFCWKQNVGMVLIVWWTDTYRNLPWLL